MTAHIEQSLGNQRQPASAKRFAVVAIPAGAMTLALFAAMENLVQVDEFSAPDQRVYELSQYMEQTRRDEPEEPWRKPPRPKPVDPPPMADPLVQSVNNPDLPSYDYKSVAPAVYGGPDMRSIVPKRATSVIDRTTQPITQPIPIYPDAAARRGITGICDVHLSVSPKGEPFNIRADCSDNVFKRAAEKAVSKVKFAPKIHDGLPVIVTGVVYPIEFRMDP